MEEVTPIRTSWFLLGSYALVRDVIPRQRLAHLCFPHNCHGTHGDCRPCCKRFLLTKVLWSVQRRTPWELVGIWLGCRMRKPWVWWKSNRLGWLMDSMVLWSWRALLLDECHKQIQSYICRSNWCKPLHCGPWCYCKKGCSFPVYFLYRLWGIGWFERRIGSIAGWHPILFLLSRTIGGLLDCQRFVQVNVVQ